MIRLLRLLRLVRLFPVKKCLTMEGLPRVGLEPAEVFTGDSFAFSRRPLDGATGASQQHLRRAHNSLQA